ncbi:MAG: hypothetical protein ACXAE3_00365 [Candidatus Kariarchaeaceae archaeon]
MKRIKHELESWGEGKAFMNRMADEWGVLVEEIDGDLKLTKEESQITCHFDERNFAFILAKVDDKMENLVQAILKEFRSN